MDLDEEIVFSDEDEEESEPTLTPRVRHMDIAMPTAAPVQESEAVGIARIVEMVGDADSELSDISRLIALEIAGVIALMSESDPLRRNNRSMKDLNDHVKAFRELQKTLTEADGLAKRDTLNFEGPKFQYFFKQMMELFQQAMTDAGVDVDLSKNVMLQFRDLIQANDDRMRREINKIEIGR